MQPQDFDGFKQAALDEGFTEVLSRSWAPAAVVEEHTHPFEVKAVVTAGEMWLTVDGRTRHLRPGDGFALPRDKPHSERYGDEGATYWVARR